MRDLQEGFSNSVVCLPFQVGSEVWRRLNRIHRMHPGPGRREQRATCSHPYLRRNSTRHSGELQGPGELGGCSASPPSSSMGAIDTSLLRGDERVSSSWSGQSGPVLQGE